MTTLKQNGNFAVVEANKFFEGLEIPMAPIPSELMDKMQIFQADLFGTSYDAHSIYDSAAFIREALTNPVEDYLLVGCGGHGVKSRAMHYYCVTEKIALFYQIFYGVAENGDENVRSRIDAAFYGIDLLLKAIEKSDKNGLIPKGKRLFVVESDFYGKGWGWIQGYPGKIDPTQWHTKDPIALSALYDIP